jgi:predicted nucleic acid-binding protein
MRQYRDVPMDFADAALVAYAERENLDEIFTLDRRGFSVYRLRGRRGFTIYP